MILLYAAFPLQAANNPTIPGAVRASPATRPASLSSDFEWCLTQAAAESAKLPSRRGPFPPASVRARAYISIAKLYVRANQPKAARKVLDTALLEHSAIPKNGVDADDVAREIVEALASSGDIEQAQALVAQMSGTSRDIAYLTIAQALAKSGQIDAAKTAAARIATTGPLAENLRPSAYQAVAAAYIKAGNPTAARTILSEQKMLSDESFASAQIASGDATAVEQAVAKSAPVQKAELLQQAAFRLESRAKPADILHLLDACEAAADMGALQTLRPEFFADNALTRLSLSDPAGARNSLKRALAALAQQNLTPLRRAYATMTIACAQSKIEDPQAGLRLLRAIDSSAVPKPQVERLDLEIASATALIHAWSGNLAEARSALTPLVTDSLAETSAVREVANAATSAGKMQDLKKWIAESEAPEIRLSIYLGAAEALIDKGRISQDR